MKPNRKSAGQAGGSRRTSAKTQGSLAEKKTAPVATGGMVRAKAKLFYNNARVEVGDVFQLIDDKHFSKRIMERVDGKAQAGAAQKPASPAESSSSTGDAGVLGE